MGEKSTKTTAVVALMAVFGLGISFIIIGAISEEMKQSLGITNAEIGHLTFALFLTSMIVQLFIGPMVDKFGHKPLAALGFLVAGGSMFLLAFSTSFSTALGASVLLGIGAMCLNTVGNTLIPVVLFDGKDPARASNFGNAFFGLGYVVTPLIFSIFASLALGYRAGVSMIGALLLIFLFIAAGTRFPQVATGFQFSMAVRLLGKGAVLIAAIALFCYISLEISMATWSKPYMTEIFGGEKSPTAVTNAGLVLSFFGVAMMLGRFLTSTIKNLTSIGVKVIAGAALISILAILLMILTQNAALAIMAVILVGLVFAPIFPTIVGITFAKFEPSLYGSIFGIIFAVGLLGGTFVPQAIGSVSVGATVQGSLYIVAAMAALLFIVALFIGKPGTLPYFPPGQ
jgi:fucose permease